MQKEHWQSITLAIIVAVVTALAHLYGMKIDQATLVTVVTAIIGGLTILAHAIITHGHLSGESKSKLTSDGWAILAGIEKVDALKKQTGTAPEGATTTTQPPPDGAAPAK